MTTYRERIEKFMDERRVNPRVRERILRLNPNPQEGEMLRGLHRKQWARTRTYHGWVGKGDFIRKFGRAAWEKIPPFYIRKDGRRQAITREAFLDNVWLWNG